MRWDRPLRLRRTISRSRRSTPTAHTVKRRCWAMMKATRSSTRRGRTIRRDSTSRARYYDPVLKRFISEDPIGTRAGPNFYKFVNNNPVLFTDPTGLICLYRQSTGRLVCYDYTTGWPPYVDTSGYSGAGAGRDNPKMQDVVDVGPIPQGCWRVGAPTGSRGTGPYSLPLTPLPDNDVFNTPRDPNSFLIHGPNASRPNDSSSGCPVIDRPSRQAIPTGEIFCVTP